MAEQAQASVSEQIVKVSTQICESTAKIVLVETLAPQKDLCYLNNHIK